MINFEIPNYTIIEKIGEGGMATVYKAVHKTLPNMYRAIKVLNPAFSFDPVIRAKFLTEARTLASLDHPNIVKIYDYIEQDRHLILIMEYVPGETLDNLIQLKTGPINEERVKSLFLQIIDAISYAHKKGLIHRDIKPSNIIIANDGTVKIIDFGIVKILEDDQSPGATKTGTKLGTPIYMAPEQILARNVDERTDIYAMGVTLFQMVTGKSPYDPALSEFEIQQEIVDKPLPKANSIYPAVSDNIQYIIDKATAKKKEDRYKNCEELKVAILNPKIPPTLPILPPQVKSKTNIVLTLSVIAVVAIVLIFIIYNFNQNAKSIEAFNQGKKNFGDENYDSALMNFTKAIEYNGNNELAWRCRGMTKHNINQFQDAIEDLSKAISLNVKDDTAYVVRGLSKESLEKYDEAILDFNKAIAIDSHFYAAYYDLATLYFSLKNYQSSLLTCISSENHGGTIKEIYLIKGRTHNALKDYLLAKQDYNSAIEIDNNYEHAYFFRGDNYAKLNEYANAIIDYDKAIKINSKYTDAYLYRCFAYYYLGNHINALNDINVSINLDPKNGYYYYLRGCIYYKNGNTSDGCTDFLKSKNLNNKDGIDAYQKYCSVNL